MGGIRVIPWVLTAILLLVCVAFCLLVWTGTLKISWAQSPQTVVPSRDEPYPIPGRVEGTTAFFTQETIIEKAPKKANASYPVWLKGPQDNGLAVDASRYFYQELVGPEVETGLQANGLKGGLLFQKA